VDLINDGKPKTQVDILLRTGAQFQTLTPFTRDELLTILDLESERKVVELQSARDSVSTTETLRFLRSEVIFFMIREHKEGKVVVARPSLPIGLVPK
jgi:hypothetical protein